MHGLSALLHRASVFIQGIAETLGGPGLALVAFLDSSFISLPEVADALIVVSVLHEPGRWLYYALATTLGSVAGCYALYAVAKKGGHAFLHRRFRADRVERGLAVFKRYGLFAVVVPSILPPPTPFKIFVLLAGVADVKPVTFLAAVAIGRGIRFGGEAWLAYTYGPAAFDYISQNVPTISAWLGGAVAVSGLAFIVWRRRRGAGSSAG